VHKNPSIVAVAFAPIALAVGLIVASNANAACGSSGYPGCVARNHIMSGGDWNHQGCISCGGWCYQFASPRERAVFEEVVKRNEGVRRVVQGNHFDLSEDDLNAVGQDNPMVALVLAEFMPSAEAHTINIKEGGISYRGIPTARTLQLKLQGSEDDAAYAATMKPMETPGAYAETRWSSKGIDDGNLEVTFHTSIIGPDAVPQKDVMPPMTVVLTSSSPVKLVTWHPAN
jgi:hypothetical protein